MTKLNQRILFFLLILFSFYCAITIGQSWDEHFHLLQGKITLDYLFSLGKIDNDIFRREYYSAFYWSIKYFLIQIIPSALQIEASHAVNLFFSLSTIIALKKLCKELFNIKVSNIVFLVLFFYPIFFGHMAFNGKNMILAFSHAWIFYIILRYFKFQNHKDKTNGYVISISALTALSSGINLFFIGTLIPIFIFILFEIFFFKRIICSNFSKKKFLLDLVKSIILSYFILVLFWIDTHPNIILLPYEYFTELLYGDHWRGYPYNLVNGTYYYAHEVPKFYFLINLIFKSPEYFLLLYIVFVFILLQDNFFRNKFKDFYYKLFPIVLIILFSIIIGFVIPFPLYDGMRFFLWSLPYFCVIPSLAIYYLFANLKKKGSLITLLTTTTLIIFFLFNFFRITPYQYTYLNLFNGKYENTHKKFENDYWGSSIKELIKISSFDKNKLIKFSTCGINLNIAKFYLKKQGYSKFQFVNFENSDYIIMTNRAVSVNDKNDSTNILGSCYDKYKGNDVYKVERKRLSLSVIRKKTN
jgi:hypothetical protein